MSPSRLSILVVARRHLVLAALIAGALVATSTAAFSPVARASGVSAPIIVSPAAGTRTASATTQISLLGPAAVGLTTISVTGSVSGPHSGRLERYASEPGESFLPAKPFVTGERVTVRVGRPVVGAASGTYSFRIGSRVTYLSPAHTPSPSLHGPDVVQYVTAPRLDPPRISVDPQTGAGGGDFLLTPKGTHGNAGPMILGADGRLIWFLPLAGERAFDLNVQHLHGRPVLTWWQGVIVAAHGTGEDVIDNTAYQTIAVLRGENGYDPDLHEFQLESNGAAYYTTYQALRWEVPTATGPKPGVVWDGILEEVDVKTGLVMYEWHSLDHVGVQLSDLRGRGNAQVPFDYFHINSIQPLSGGDLLVSARNTSAVYEIDPAEGGTVLWELGGKRSTFALPAGSTFWYQHDARMIAADEISLFDDESGHSSRSRGVVFRIDPATKTAVLLHEYTYTSPLAASGLGNVQTLANGDVVISWGTAPDVSELSPTSSVLFNAVLPPGDNTYRAYRAPWQATPTTPISVVTHHNPDGPLGVYVSWNGATSVASWRVVGGTTPTAHKLLASAPDTAFQTMLDVPASTTSLSVLAVSATGRVIRRSNLVSVIPVEPVPFSSLGGSAATSRSPSPASSAPRPRSS